MRVPNSFADAGPDLGQTPPISLSTRLVTPSCFASSSVSSIFLVSGTLENVGPPASLGMIYTDTVSAEFFFSIIKRMLFFSSLFIGFSDLLVVTLITGLILCGLIIDLGGGPDHKRLGFTVPSLQFRHLSTS